LLPFCYSNYAFRAFDLKESNGSARKYVVPVLMESQARAVLALTWQAACVAANALATREQFRPWSAWPQQNALRPGVRRLPAGLGGAPVRHDRLRLHMQHLPPRAPVQVRSLRLLITLLVNYKRTINGCVFRMEPALVLVSLRQHQSMAFPCSQPHALLSLVLLHYMQRCASVQTLHHSTGCNDCRAQALWRTAASLLARVRLLHERWQRCAAYRRHSSRTRCLRGFGGAPGGRQACNTGAACQGMAQHGAHAPVVARVCIYACRHSRTMSCGAGLMNVI